MKSDKIERVSSIADEVSELHPLLEELLPNIPTVRKCEYTHGPHEMGADFVVERSDSALGDITYVGVIAKVGSLTQNNQELKRQIEECGVERLFEHGRKRIRITEIWVVATGNITQNAQRTIEAAYPTQAIRFIEKRRLTELIDSYLPSYWQDLPVHLSSYFAKLRSNIDVADGNANLGLGVDQSFYIDLELEEDESDGRVRRKGLRRYSDKKRNATRPKKKSAVELPRLLAEGEALILIEGEMGAGKSKLLRETAKFHMDPTNFSRHKLVPIHCYASTLVKEHEGVLQRLIEGVDPSVTKLVEKNDYSWLLLVDGLDEILCDPSEHQALIAKFFDEVRSISRSKAVFATRPLSTSSLVRPEIRGIKRLRIRPLSFNKVSQFIKHVCVSQELSHRLVADVQQSHLFRNLPQSPIAAILLSRLIRDTAQELPRTMTELYSKAIELMLGRWDETKLLSTNTEYEAAVAIGGTLAVYMLDHDLAVIAEAEARRCT